MYQGNITAPHNNVILGNLTLAQEGEMWGSGADLGTKIEQGIALKLEEEEVGTASPFACGALMPTKQEPKYRIIIRGFEPPNENFQCLV